MRILSIGELIFDLFAEGEFIGGAPLNFAFHAARLGHTVAMVTALGYDARGKRALEFVKGAGIEPRFIQNTPLADTGVVRVHLTECGQPSYVLTRPAAYDYADFGPEEAKTVASWTPDWIYFGSLFNVSPQARESTQNILQASSGSKRFYDVNLRNGHYTAELLLHLAPLANILKLNQEEAEEVGSALGVPFTNRAEFTHKLSCQFGYLAVCMTLGADGCAIYAKGDYIECPSKSIELIDAVGAGDAFAASFLHGWGSGWTIQQIGRFANQVGGLVASRSGATPAWSPADLYS